MGTAFETGWALLELAFGLLAQGLGVLFVFGEAHEAPGFGVQVGGFLVGQPSAFSDEEAGA